MSRWLLIAQREYLENVRTKGFWLGILMLPFLLLLVALVPLVVESTREAKHYLVIDQSGWLGEAVQQQIDRDDFAILLTQVRDGAGNSALPDNLVAFLHLLQALTESQVQAAASMILVPHTPGSESAPVTLPDAVLEYIERHGRQMANWWHAMPPGEKAAWAPAISLNRFVRVDASDFPDPNKAVASGQLFGYFVIGEAPVVSAAGGKYVSNNLTDRELANWFGDYASRQVRRERLRQENLSSEIAGWINEPIEFEGIHLNPDGAELAVETRDVVRQWTPVVFVYLLWISILINTQMLLTNTIEEKSNKLIEVLLSSVSPLALMAGKIIGIAGTGLTIICAWTVMALTFFLLLPAMAGIALPFDIAGTIAEPRLLGSFLVYFLLGYLLYAALLVGLGSICNNLKEAQNLMLPVQLVQMVPIFVMVPIGRDPNGALAQALSWFPPLTPFVMMNRAAAPPSLTEYVGTTLLLVISIAGALWFAAKIFRIGILLTGKPPGLLEILRWLRAPTV